MLLRALAAAAIMGTAPALAQTPNTNWPNYREDNFVITDYKFASGETIPQLKLHYRTLGAAERNAAGEIDNGVLLLQGNTGTGANWLRPKLGRRIIQGWRAFGYGPILHHYPGRACPRRLQQAF